MQEIMEFDDLNPKLTEIPAGFNELHTTLSHQTAALRSCVVVNVRRGFRD